MGAETETGCEGLISRLDTGEERLSKLDDVEIGSSKTEKRLFVKKLKRNSKHHGTTMNGRNTCEYQKEKEEKKKEKYVKQ